MFCFFSGKYALGAIRKKIAHDNPHVALYALQVRPFNISHVFFSHCFELICVLQVLESVVKNCGSDVHNELATREFMDFMRETAQVCTIVFALEP